MAQVRQVMLMSLNLAALVTRIVVFVSAASAASPLPTRASSVCPAGFNAGRRGPHVTRASRPIISADQGSFSLGI
jgi:hypothetical protein